MSESSGPSNATAGRLSDDGLWYWDGQQWRSTLSEDGRWRWDGEQWRPAETSTPPAPSGNLVASEGALGRKGMETLCVSPDARRLAWIAPQGRAAVVVLDGQPLDAYDEIRDGSLAFSPDSRRFTHQAMRSKDQHFVVVDGQQSGPYQRSANFIFSPDGNHYAYMAKSGGQWRVIRDGVPGPPFDNMYPPDFYFSRDSAHVGYLTSRGKQRILMVDTTERPIDCDQWLTAALALSGDASRVAVGVGRNKKSFVLVDAVEQGPYDTLLDAPVAFSPSGEHVAYAVKNGGRAFVVRDGQPQQPYDSIATSSESIAWSPVGDRLAYVGGRGAQSVTVVDGDEWEPCHGVQKLAFSPDGKQLAVIEDFGTSRAVVVDRVAGKPYLGIGELVFDPTGAHLAYLAMATPQSFVLVRDEQELPLEGALASPIVFDSDGAIHYIEMRRTGLYFVERG
jgi:WD40 repeat protein